MNNTFCNFTNITIFQSSLPNINSFCCSWSNRRIIPSSLCLYTGSLPDSSSVCWSRWLFSFSKVQFIINCFYEKYFIFFLNNYRLGAMATPYVAQVLFQTSVWSAVSIYGIFAVLASIACLLLPYETRGADMVQ